MIKLYSKDIHCINCTNRIEKAFKRESINIELSLADKTILVNETDKEKAIELLEDLGFETKLL